eukprot:TRINITY_DN12383_c0_g1_i1.p1 TRINITY_DN12383_c0_g1~~TRINITY_DN12383_c0_g1_i1.p1  ORF type:complete len:478 (-),score=55.16 TRINITY_DN12383_c0_g1_i1:523-1956(-)
MCIHVSTDGTSDGRSEADHEDRVVEVRWMASGCVACYLTCKMAITLESIKQLIFDAIGVPSHEQRLFAKGQQLTCKGAVPELIDVHPRLLLVRSVGDQFDTNVGYFHGFADSPADVPDGTFTVVKRIAPAIHGEVLECNWLSADESVDCEGHVAVKRIARTVIDSFKVHNADERTLHLNRHRAPHAEDALTEIGVLSFLSKRVDLPEYILRMHGIFSDARHVWIVSELARGGDLFSLAASGKQLPEKHVQHYSRQLLVAVAYLHEHGIGHRDISLENVLLDRPHDSSLPSNVRLMDFGMSVQSRSASGTLLRYFLSVGKDFYRAPECHMPAAAREVSIFSPMKSQPGDIVQTACNGVLCEVRLPQTATPGKVCKAEIWGYEVPPADVFSCAVCVFILGWQSPLWNRAVLGDRSFAFFHGRGDSGVADLLRSWKKQAHSSNMLELVSEMLRVSPGRRPTAAACLGRSWFADTHLTTEM